MEFGYVEACALWIMQQLILHFWLIDIHDFSLNSITYSYPQMLTGNVKAQPQNGGEQIGWFPYARIAKQHFFTSLK